MSHRVIFSVLGLMFAITVLQVFKPLDWVPSPAKAPQQEVCIGQPIRVQVPYTGSVNEPWTCQVQCEDDQPRYILYSNGLATQCETPPGCNDYGEDRGITCLPPESAASGS